MSFAPLAFKLFYAARHNTVLRRSPFRPRKNVSLAPRVPMSTFSKPSEPMRPRNCRRHPVGWGGVVGCTASRTRVPAALVSAQQRLTLANHRAPRCPPRAHSSSKASRRSESRAAGANRRDGVRELVRVVRDHRRRRRGHGEREARHWQWRRRRSTWRRPVKVKLCVCSNANCTPRAWPRDFGRRRSALSTTMGRFASSTRSAAQHAQSRALTAGPGTTRASTMRIS